MNKDFRSGKIKNSSVSSDIEYFSTKEEAESNAINRSLKNISESFGIEKIMFKGRDENDADWEMVHIYKAGTKIIEFDPIRKK